MRFLQWLFDWWSRPEVEIIFSPTAVTPVFECPFNGDVCSGDECESPRACALARATGGWRHIHRNGATRD